MLPSSRSVASHSIMRIDRCQFCWAFENLAFGLPSNFRLWSTSQQMGLLHG